MLEISASSAQHSIIKAYITSIAVICRLDYKHSIVEQAFERLITSFVEDRVGLIDSMLVDSLSSDLRGHILQLLLDGKLKPAGIGNNDKLVTDAVIRSDRIYWLDRKHNIVHENIFFDFIDEFVSYLNRSCYTGITGYEFHYAYFDEGNSFKRHLDQFKDNQTRAYSMIMYLNSDWVAGDGGQLCIYHDGRTQVVDPTYGRCVFFKSSELEHEVLLNHKPRMSITGWLKTD